MRGAKVGGGETRWEPPPNGDTHPFFLVPCFRVALFLSQPGFPFPLLSPPSGRLPSSLLRYKTRPCHLRRCRDTLPQITGPARQPLGALRLWDAQRAQCRGCPAPGLAAWALLHQEGRAQQCGLPETPAPLSGHSDLFPVHAGESPPASVCALALLSAARIAYYFYPRCCLRPILASTGLAGLLGVGVGKLDADQAGKKSLAGQLSRVGGWCRRGR